MPEGHPFVAIGLVAGLAATARAQTSYTLHVLPWLGEPHAWAYDIDETGDIAGASFKRLSKCCASRRPVVWNDDSIVEVIDRTGSSLGLNNIGVVVGQAAFAFDERRAWVWDGTTVSFLPSLGGTKSAAMDINDAGRIAGWTQDLDDRPQAAMWIDGKLIVLGNHPGGFESYAEGLNEAGAIVGSAATVDDYAHRATLWEGGRTVMIENGAGEIPQSEAFAINNRRQVVGVAWDLEVEGYTARRWDEDGDGWHMTDLPSLAPAMRSVAFDINDSGVIVGEAGWEDAAVMWVDDAIIDLNDVVPSGYGWTLREARAINESGWIVGSGVDASGDHRAFLLIPVPGACPADVTSDGRVDTDDILAVLAGWGADGAADVTGDGVVDNHDLLQVLAAWGPCDS